MSAASLLADVQKFIGYPLLSHIDAIEAIAKRNRFSVLAVGPGAPQNIDVDKSRLNVRQDKDGKIISFSIG